MRILAHCELGLVGNGMGFWVQVVALIQIVLLFLFELKPLLLLLLLLNLAHLDPEVEDVLDHGRLGHDSLLRWRGLWHVLRLGGFSMQEGHEDADLQHVHEFPVERLLEDVPEVVVGIQYFELVLVDQEGDSYTGLLDRVLVALG